MTRASSRPLLQTLLQRYSCCSAPHSDKTTSQSSSDLGARRQFAARPARTHADPRAQIHPAPVRQRHAPLRGRDQPGERAAGRRGVRARDRMAGAESSADITSKPASFAVPISAAAALDGGFASRMAASLDRHAIDEGLVMLIVPAAAWAAQPQSLVPLLDACEQHHCRVMLDDFELNDAALQLLKYKAIRMLKLSAELTARRCWSATRARCCRRARTLRACWASTASPSAWNLPPPAAGWPLAGVDYLDPFNPAETAAATGGRPARPWWFYAAGFAASGGFTRARTSQAGTRRRRAGLTARFRHRKGRSRPRWRRLGS